MSQVSLIWVILSQSLEERREDVKCRIGKARVAFNVRRTVWNASSISTKIKLCIFTTNVKATILYGSDTWKVTQVLSNKLALLTNASGRPSRFTGHKRSARNNFGAGQDKSTYQLRLQDGHGLGKATHCKNQSLSLPSRP